MAHYFRTRELILPRTAPKSTRSPGVDSARLDELNIYPLMRLRIDHALANPPRPHQEENSPTRRHHGTWRCNGNNRWASTG